MKTWTVDEMMAERPCPDYDRRRVEDLWAGRKRLSLAEILRLDIPAADRMWAAWRPTALTPEQRVTIRSRIFSRSAGILAKLHNRTHALHCGVAEVESWAMRWLSGKDRSSAADWDAARAATDAARRREREAQVRDVLDVIEGRNDDEA